MTQPGAAEDFAGHAFLEGLDEKLRARLAAGVRPFNARAGDYLTREGESARSFYLIGEGKVAIGTNLGERGAVPIQTVGANEVVGWSWLWAPYRWQFDARAIEAVAGFAFDADWLRQQCEQDHELGYQLFKRLVGVIGSRLTATRMQQMDIYK